MHDGAEQAFHLVFGSMVHGDEVGSLPALVRVMEALQSGALRYGGRLTLFVGNPEAGRAGRRFLDSDLNRVFVPDPPDDHEGRRARQLAPLLDAADVFVDFHQTILATRYPFYICPFQVDGWRWARALAATPMWVTRHPDAAFSSGTMCADEFVRARGLPGITVELSRMGFDAGAAATAERVIREALALADAIARGERTLVEAAEARPELSFLHTVHREAFPNPRMALREGLANFDEVSAGDLLSASGTPPMRAPQSGWVLFPKYPDRVDGVAVEPRPGEIYRIVQPLPEHPLVAYGLEA